MGQKLPYAPQQKWCLGTKDRWISWESCAPTTDQSGTSVGNIADVQPPASAFECVIKRETLAAAFVSWPPHPITSSSINIGELRPPVVADLANRSVQFDPFLVRADSKMLGAAGEA